MGGPSRMTGPGVPGAGIDLGQLEQVANNQAVAKKAASVQMNMTCLQLARDTFAAANNPEGHPTTLEVLDRADEFYHYLLKNRPDPLEEQDG